MSADEAVASQASSRRSENFVETCMVSRSRRWSVREDVRLKIRVSREFAQRFHLRRIIAVKHKQWDETQRTVANVKVFKEATEKHKAVTSAFKYIWPKGTSERKLGCSDQRERYGVPTRISSPKYHFDPGVLSFVSPNSFID